MPQQFASRRYFRQAGPNRTSRPADAGTTGSPSSSTPAASSQDPNRVLLNEHKAARVLSVSVRTLQAWRHRGGGPRFLKLGTAVRYRLADLDEFLDLALRRSTSDPGPEAA